MQVDGGIERTGLVYANFGIVAHIRKIAMSFFLLISPFFVLLTIIRQKKGTGFSPFSSFFQKAEKDSEVSFFFLFYDLLYFNSFNTLYSSLRIP